MEYFWSPIKIGLPFSQTVDPAISYGSYPNPPFPHLPTTTTPSVPLFAFESKRVRHVIYFREPILKKRVSVIRLTNFFPWLIAGSLANQ